eukprot:4621892-Ditylum_brightwellii.AAC.1
MNTTFAQLRKAKKKPENTRRDYCKKCQEQLQKKVEKGLGKDKEDKIARELKAMRKGEAKKQLLIESNPS